VRCDLQRRECAVAYCRSIEVHLTVIRIFPRRPGYRKRLKIWRSAIREWWLLAVVLALLVSGFAASPWSFGLTVRHVLALPNCNAARMVLSMSEHGVGGARRDIGQSIKGVALSVATMPSPIGLLATGLGGAAATASVNNGRILLEYDSTSNAGPERR
jgi:hypothetical protein